MEAKERLLSALSLYRTEPIDFVDAYHASFMRERKLKAIYSYDSDFDILPGLQRLEP